MTLLAPERLLLLVPVIALAIGYVFLQRHRRHYAVRFTNLELLDSVAPKRPGWRRHAVAGVAGLALVAMVIGLARPARDEKIPREQAVVMLAIDVSRSMTATFFPARFRRYAAVSPVSPAPMIPTSTRRSRASGSNLGICDESCQ